MRDLPERLASCKLSDGSSISNFQLHCISRNAPTTSSVRGEGSIFSGMTSQYTQVPNEISTYERAGWPSMSNSPEAILGGYSGSNRDQPWRLIKLIRLLFG